MSDRIEEAEVVFIYDNHHSPCHAVVKNVDGPWSRNRVGLCGASPDETGPMPWCKEPDGGLCARCKLLVERAPDGTWRTNAGVSEPEAPRVPPPLVHEAKASGRHVHLTTYLEGGTLPIKATLTFWCHEDATACARVLTEARSTRPRDPRWGP